MIARRFASAANPLSPRLGFAGSTNPNEGITVAAIISGENWPELTAQKNGIVPNMGNLSNPSFDNPHARRPVETSTNETAACIGDSQAKGTISMAAGNG
jgi:hypothetical protein